MTMYSQQRRRRPFHHSVTFCNLAKVNIDIGMQLLKALSERYERMMNDF